MWLAVEVPDECEPEIRKCIDWLHSDRFMVSSFGAAMTVMHTSTVDIKLAVRILDMEISGRELPGDMSDLSRI